MKELKMETSKLLSDIISTYEKYGWKLRRVLLRPETRAQPDFDQVENVPVEEARIDALWFSRPSFGGREAWELRLLAETPYALFETFAPTNSKENQEEVRRQLEERLYETFAPPKSKAAKPDKSPLDISPS
jgi:hypothetical protein